MPQLQTKTSSSAIFYKRLDAAHKHNDWDRLKLHPRHDYQWFVGLQEQLIGRLARPTINVVLFNTCQLSQTLKQMGKDEVTKEIVETLLRSKMENRSFTQLRRRVYRVANLVFFEIMQEMSAPIVAPRYIGRSHHHQESSSSRDVRVFTQEEIQKLISIGPIGPTGERNKHTELMLKLLFTTGLRIGAVATMEWSQVWQPEINDARRVAVVVEKGGSKRAMILTEEVRTILVDIHSMLEPDLKSRVFPWTVHTLRCRFNNACRRAGITGEHCHPHNARHTVAHMLFNEGNSIAMISKFLGHRNVNTTSSFYLKLSYEEILGQMAIPWMMLSANTSHVAKEK